MFIKFHYASYDDYTSLTLNWKYLDHPQNNFIHLLNKWRVIYCSETNFNILFDYLLLVFHRLFGFALSRNKIFLMKKVFEKWYYIFICRAQLRLSKVELFRASIIWRPPFTYPQKLFINYAKKISTNFLNYAINFLTYKIILAQFFKLW